MPSMRSSPSGGQAAALALALVVLMAQSCATYGVGFVLRGDRNSAAAPASPGEPATPLEASEVEAGAGVVDSVAEAFRMARQVDFRTGDPRLLDDESQVLLRFEAPSRKGRVEDGGRSRIVLVLALSRDGSELRFVLQDLDRGSESARFRRIESALARRLDDTFAGRRIDRRQGRFASERAVR